MIWLSGERHTIEMASLTPPGLPSHFEQHKYQRHGFKLLGYYLKRLIESRRRSALQHAPERSNIKW